MNTPTNIEGIDPEALGGIFSEAILFIAIFTVMAIISLMISKRSAKKYESDHSVKERKEGRIKDELVHKFLNSSSIKIVGKKVKHEELLKKLKHEAITQEEYQILKEHLDSI